MRKKKKGILRRLLRGLLWLLSFAVLYSIILGYLPFAHAPALTDELGQEAEARAEEMSCDIETADRAAILETRTQALDERIRLISQAKRELILTTYDCRDGQSTRDILCAVLKKADEGVHVRILIDGVAGRFFVMGRPLFRAVAAHPNVEVRFYNLFTYVIAWRHMGRMHDKYIIVDDLAYILGGRNTFDYFLGEYPAPTHSRDRETLVYNAAHGTAAGDASSLYQVKNYFESIWNGKFVLPFRPHVRDARRDAVYAELNARRDALAAASPELFRPVDYADMTVKTRGIWLIHNPTTIYAKQPTVFAQLTALMARAEKSVTIHSPYCVMNDYTRGVFTDLCGKVPVTLMVNAVENGQNIVASGDYLFHRKEVLGTGFRVLEYAGGDSYHGKSIAIDDDIAIIGSYNQDLRSTYVDTELMLVVRSRDINAELRANMEALHRDCQERLPDGTAVVPEGLTMPALSFGRGLAMRVIGAAMQLVRNIV